MKRISLENIIRAVDGQLIGQITSLDGYVKRVVTDSRSVQSGDLYIAIVGERFDGHDFLQQAFESGALVALTSKETLGLAGCTIKVDDTRLALGKLAAYYRSLFDLPVIGITGSVGKTSTKEMMASILEQKYRVHKTSGNFNNDIGLPLTLLGLEDEYDVAVVELGMNHFGEIDYLGNILKPTIGIIANIGVSHIEFLGSREGILKAKCEMIPHISSKGCLILNGDDQRLRSVKDTNGIKTLYYGQEERFDCTMVNHHLIDQGQKITVSTKTAIYAFEVAYPGAHILHNALACILVAEELGLSKEAIIRGIKSYTPAGMRLNTYTLKEGITLIDDAYNASVESMESGLKTLRDMTLEDKQRVAVLGSMFEMGDYARQGHLDVGALTVKYGVDQLLTVGKEAKWINEGALKAGMPKAMVDHFDEQKALIEALGRFNLEKSVILLKGSRGMHLEKTRDYLIESFEEVQ